MNKEPLKGKIIYASTNDSVVVDDSIVMVKDIKSAVEWLKKEIKSQKVFLIHPARRDMLNKLIDEAFEDVM